MIMETELFGKKPYQLKKKKVFTQKEKNTEKVKEKNENENKYKQTKIIQVTVIKKNSSKISFLHFPLLHHTSPET